MAEPYDHRMQALSLIEAVDELADASAALALSPDAAESLAASCASIRQDAREMLLGTLREMPEEELNRFRLNVKETIDDLLDVAADYRMVAERIPGLRREKE